MTTTINQTDPTKNNQWGSQWGDYMNSGGSADPFTGFQPNGTYNPPNLKVGDTNKYSADVIGNDTSGNSFGPGTTGGTSIQQTETPNVTQPASISSGIQPGYVNAALSLAQGVGNTYNLFHRNDNINTNTNQNQYTDAYGRPIYTAGNQYQDQLNRAANIDTGFSWSNVAQDTATGASIGSMFPGYGTIIGGAIGAVAGIGTSLGAMFSGESKRDKMRNRAKQNLAIAQHMYNAKMSQFNQEQQAQQVYNNLNNNKQGDYNVQQFTHM